MVVKALNTTARGVLLAITSVTPPSARRRSTRWMPLATPSPKRSGRTMRLAKLNGRFKSTEAATVNSAARTSGAKTRATSPGRRSNTASSSAMATKASTAASRKAPTTVLPASRMTTGDPVACGATARTAPTKRRNAWRWRRFSLGYTSTLARPSAVIWRRRKLSGRSSSVTGPALRESLRARKRPGRSAISRASSSSRTPGGGAPPPISAANAIDSRRAASPRGTPLAARAKPSRSPCRAVTAAPRTAPSTAVSSGTAVRAGARNSAMSSMTNNFSSWSAGT